VRRPSTPSHLLSVPSYIGAGGLSTGAHYLVMTLMVAAAGVRPILATLAGFAVGAAVKYALNYKLTFRSDTPHMQAVVRFVALLATLFAANAALFWLLNEVAGLHYLVAQVVTTAALIIPGYAASREWVFR
jgi:putative flippase GtrA